MEMTTLYDYLRIYGPRELGRRIVETFPPLHAPDDPPAPELSRLMRKPLPAQELAIMGCVKYLADHDAVKIVGECGTGKTFMAGAGVAYVAAHSKPFSTIVMCPPHLTEKWAREILITVPQRENLHHRGSAQRRRPEEAARRGGDSVHQWHHAPPRPRDLSSGIAGHGPASRGSQQHPYPTYFIVGKEKGKLGYYWKHVYGKAGEAAGSTQAVSSTSTRA